MDLTLSKNDQDAIKDIVTSSVQKPLKEQNKKAC